MDVVAVAVLTLTFRISAPAGAEIGVALLCRTVGTEPEDREVAEPSLVPEPVPQQVPDGLQLRWVDTPDPIAALTGQVFAFAATDQPVQPRAMPDVDVAHHAELLERGQVPVHRGDVRASDAPARALSDVLGRHRPVGREQRVEDQPPGSRQPVAPFAQD